MIKGHDKSRRRQSRGKITECEMFFDSTLIKANPQVKRKDTRGVSTTFFLFLFFAKLKRYFRYLDAVCFASTGGFFWGHKVHSSGEISSHLIGSGSRLDNIEQKTKIRLMKVHFSKVTAEGFLGGTVEDQLRVQDVRLTPAMF